MSSHTLVVIGAGPAGIAAAIWARSLGLDCEVVDAGDAPGGQLHRVYNRVVDYPGMVVSDGEALASRFAEHLSELDANVRTGCRVTSIDVTRRVVRTDAGDLASRFLLIATGVRRRTLGIPGEAEFVGRGVSPSASRYAGQFAGRDVLVVGGGDAAFEEALILARVCRTVTLAHRGERFRARPDFRERVAEAPNITVVTRATLEAIEGDTDVERAVVTTPAGRQVLPVSGVFICAGIVPNSELVAGQLACDERGFVRVTGAQRTSVDTVYAAGDVCSGSSLTIAAAVGEGAAAVKDIQRRIAAQGDE